MRVATPLITRADDFGASPGTNDAILACLDAGFIRNVGVMIPTPFLEHRLDELIERQDSFCLGLHATLTSEWATLRWGPVLPREKVPSLLETDGNFFASTQSLHDRARLSEMTAEIQAQLDLCRRLRLAPQYLDLHMPFHWIPGVSEAMLDLCGREGLVVGNSPRFANVSLGEEQRLEAQSAAQAVSALTVSHPGQIPVCCYHPAKRDPVSEIFYSDPDRPSTTVAEVRHLEYETLSDPARMASFARDAGIIPTTYLAPDL